MRKPFTAKVSPPPGNPNPFEPPGPSGWTRKRTVLAAATAVLLVIAGVAGYVVVTSLLNTCGSGVTRHDGQCVGVTDGSYVFAPALRTVESDIKRANDQLTKAYVTVAFLGPLTASTDVSITRIRSELEGAYVAQYRANQEHGVGIRLVLANVGNTEHQWQPVVRQLSGMASGPHPLVAVTGMGISVPQTAQAGHALSTDHIPMIGAVITGDRLDYPRIHGLVRVNPDVSDEAAALARYLGGAGLGDRAMLVQDTNPGDLYTQSLNTDFRAQLARYITAGGFPEEPFDAAPGSKDLQGQFYVLSSKLCGPNPPDLILYAGRAGNLPDFIRQLWQRGENCEPRRTITVVTGSDASSLPGQLKPGLNDAPVRVIYPALANPGELARRPNGRNNRVLWARFLRVFQRRGFAQSDLGDGWAIMSNDAVTAAQTAVNAAMAGLSGGVPGNRDVGGVLRDLGSVPGAAGLFGFDPATGNPTGRDFPVMELEPNGSQKVLEVYPLPTPRAGQ
jgi:ABC-type branched-subunit amino acid transport system substrate-binding protein